MDTTLLEHVRRLSVDEQMALIEALWDGLTNDGALPVPTEAQKAELDRRLAEHDANPDDIAPWSQVKAEALARTRR